MSGHNIHFQSEIRKIIFELSSIPPLIWSFDICRKTGFSQLRFLLIKYCYTLCSHIISMAQNSCTIKLFRSSIQLKNAFSSAEKCTEFLLVKEYFFLHHIIVNLQLVFKY